MLSGLGCAAPTRRLRHRSVSPVLRQDQTWPLSVIDSSGVVPVCRPLQPGRPPLRFCLPCHLFALATAASLHQVRPANFQAAPVSKRNWLVFAVREPASYSPPPAIPALLAPVARGQLLCLARRSRCRNRS